MAGEAWYLFQFRAMGSEWRWSLFILRWLFVFPNSQHLGHPWGFSVHGPPCLVQTGSSGPRPKAPSSTVAPKLTFQGFPGTPTGLLTGSFQNRLTGQRCLFRKAGPSDPLSLARPSPSSQCLPPNRPAQSLVGWLGEVPDKTPAGTARLRGRGLRHTSKGACHSPGPWGEFTDATCHL